MNIYSSSSISHVWNCVLGKKTNFHCALVLFQVAHHAYLDKFPRGCKSSSCQSSCRKIWKHNQHIESHLPHQHSKTKNMGFTAVCFRQFLREKKTRSIGNLCTTPASFHPVYVDFVGQLLDKRTLASYYPGPRHCTISPNPVREQDKGGASCTT